MLERLLRVFGAGAAGGFANSLVVWGFGSLGICGAFGVAISPELTPAWLYPRIVWGGIWGVLLFLPILKTNLWIRALVLSFGPTIIQLLVVFPFKAGKGLGGLELGLLTPLFVLFFNYVWGLVAVRLADGSESR